MRELFVAELVKDMLGPRGGAHEVMTHSPLSEYITGVLAPRIADIPAFTGMRPESIDGEPVSTSAPEPAEDEYQEQDVQAPPLLSPALDPRSLPVSFGISFAVETDKTPEADICLTWARYYRIKRGGTVNWQRRPRYVIFTLRLDQRGVFYFDDSGEQVPASDAEISFHVEVKDLNGRRWLVNLYFVNRIRVSSGERPGVEHHIFQPQIRVVLKEGTKMVPADILRGEDEESQELSFLFRNRPVMGRGFLCSVVWRDIDPQQNYSGRLDFPECREEPPFGWPDGEIIPQEYRDRFRVPDIRSEFIPLYSIPFPDMDWPDNYGDPPELRADILAETYDPDALIGALIPLVNRYEQWVQSLNHETSRLSPAEQQIAGRIVQRCEEVLRRMRAGLDILKRDGDVRLAFCFANKVMDLQARWAGRGPLRWRPFQLGYILMTLESVANQNSPDREVCDLLWVPTGAGKTEAYLFLIVFTLALRRRRAQINGRIGSGTAVIMRYTLRLLTIQQFRRLLRAITACEYLRVDGLGTGTPVGWRPENCNISGDFIWGSEPFSAGLWVGGGVTPNRLRNTWGGNRRIPGALSILREGQGEGEPAQVLNCPACNSILAIPEEGISGHITLHLVIEVPANVSQNTLQNCINTLSGLTFNRITVRSAYLTQHSSAGFYTLSLELDINGKAEPRDIDTLWQNLQHILPQGITLIPARASRPGYFIRWYTGQRGGRIEYDFEIFCPDPECPLHRMWCAGTPLGWVHGTGPHPYSPTGGIPGIPDLRDGNRFVRVQEPFRWNSNFYISDRIPIPALTVDEQVYHRLPSVIVATVDKLARPPFESHASGIFGNVDHYHCVWGYYREGAPPASAAGSRRVHPGPAGRGNSRNYIQIFPPDPPELIVQDELHLIDGPLGSLVGFYETAVGYLCEENGNSIKYIASTATVRNAREQVQNVFVRRLFVFPPPGLTVDDHFFIRERESHPLEDGPPGRLYVGVCAPGRGPLTPQIRIYARLLQTAEEIRKNHPHMDVDPYWTLTGYFNAIRELGGARALYRQDIPERLMQIAGNRARRIPDDRTVELSSRTSSTSLPAILDLLSRSHPDAPDFLFTTSMFGTGVDIPRISLMVVNGQPKTTSSYIQATGRVGRQRGALVITFLRATRPRDLSHYEFFCGYHRQLHRYVEPLSVYPFAPGVLERALGPVCVFLLRNMRNTENRWHEETRANLMASQRNAAEVRHLLHIFNNRNSGQSPQKQHGNLQSIVDSELDRWQNVAGLHGNLRYVEYVFIGTPRYPVVLGDPPHRHAGMDVVYENVPQSLRDIEETCGFET